MQEIEFLHSLLQKVIVKYAPNAKQKSVDFVENCLGQIHPDYSLWQDMVANNSCHRISYGCNNKKDIKKMIVRATKNLRSILKEKETKLLVWRGETPFLYVGKSGQSHRLNMIFGVQ